MDENTCICKNCKLSYTVEADGKQYLMCDRLEKVVKNKGFCDDWEAD